MDRMIKVITDIPGNILAPCTLENIAYQVDPYVGCGHYCYYCYVLDQAETDWTHEVLTYRDIKERLEAELSEIPPQIIYMGWQTDPYQPCEADWGQTRQVLELLLDLGFSANILTKSDLVLRDMDLLRQMPQASVSFSVAFNHDGVRRLFEYNTMDTAKRIFALAELQAAGVGTAALICPVVPYITDAVELVENLEPYTNRIWLYGLSIPDQSQKNWRNIKRILELNFPKIREKVEAAVFSREDQYWTQTRQDLTLLKKNKSMNLLIHL